MYLSEINIYPVKSLAGISLNESKIERRGLEFDRRWMLIDENNKFLTQREFPKMATVKTEILNGALGVSNNGSAFQIPFAPPSHQIATVKIWSSRCKARIYDDLTNEWFSDVLQTNCKLALMPEETLRTVNYFYAVQKDDHVSFADGYPFLLIGENSLAELNSRLEEPLPMNRFRPNFVVAGAEGFAEDGWKKIKIGETIFHVVKPCGRCVITTIEQFRIPKRSIKKKILFGQYLIAENAGGALRVGDEAQALETKRAPKFL
jgi:uncharacterized protein YcbX